MATASAATAADPDPTGATGVLVAYTLTGATGGELRAFSPDFIPFSQVTAYAYDPQGNLAQPVTLITTTFPALTAQVRSSSVFDGFGGSATFPADKGDDFDPVAFGGQFGYYHDFYHNYWPDYHTDGGTGLYLLTHRYYDAGAGRFVSRDPIGYKGGINLYGFAGNNPVNRMDPEGTQEALPTDSMAYVGNMFNNLTPRDWLHALKHNDVTRGVEMLLNIASYYTPVGEERAAVAATEVILDTNAVYQLPKALALLKPGEVPVITRTVAAELRNNAARAARGIRSPQMPNAASSLKVIEDAVNPDTAINIRGFIRAASNKKKLPGLMGDGRIGATAIATHRRIISSDRLFVDSVNHLGGAAQRIP